LCNVIAIPELPISTLHHYIRKCLERLPVIAPTSYINRAVLHPSNNDADHISKVLNSLDGEVKMYLNI